MKINGIQFINTFGYGQSVNELVYPPLGLIRVGMAVEKAFGDRIKIWVDDEHHREVSMQSDAQIVGIYANTLTYPRSLHFARQAKEAGKIVVMGGPHMILRDLILCNRPEIDYVICGKGELAMTQLVEALERRRSFENVYSLSWRKGDKIVNNPLMSAHLWSWEEYCFPDYDLLSTGIKPYHNAFTGMHPEGGNVFYTFSHFGCRFRELMEGKNRQFCIFCSLCDSLVARSPNNILAEIKYYLDHYCQIGDVVHIKDYGDDIGGQPKLVCDLLEAVESCKWWHNYNISFAFYCRSSELTKRLAEAFQKLNASLFFGFDSADDKVLEENGKGITIKSHWRAIKLCKKYNIPIQASMIAGLQGETSETLAANLEFAKKLEATKLVERFNSGMLIVLPGTPCFEMLAEKEPWLRNCDVLTPDITRELWHQHFTDVSVDKAEKNARAIDKLSPLHGSMGYEKR